MTGSHGGLIGGDPAAALRVNAFAAVFNDAGRIDGPGIGRLAVLDRRGILALCVATSSAMIGDAPSTFHSGVISSANRAAVASGAVIGEPLQDCLRRLAFKTTLRSAVP